MADYNIVYWQEIPSLVDAKDADGSHKVQLSQRYQDLIDLAAMKRSMAGTDAYLEQWTRSDTEQRDGTAEAVAQAVADELEAQFETFKAAVGNG
jgi:seryl-tRNA(Sec) selenium transferase